jgi:hypothetical protein
LDKEHWESIMRFLRAAEVLSLVQYAHQMRHLPGVCEYPRFDDPFVGEDLDEAILREERREVGVGAMDAPNPVSDGEWEELRALGLVIQSEAGEPNRRRLRCTSRAEPLCRALGSPWHRANFSGVDRSRLPETYLDAVTSARQNPALQLCDSIEFNSAYELYTECIDRGPIGFHFIQYSPSWQARWEAGSFEIRVGILRFLREFHDKLFGDRELFNLVLQCGFWQEEVWNPVRNALEHAYALQTGSGGFNLKPTSSTYRTEESCDEEDGSVISHTELVSLTIEVLPA